MGLTVGAACSFTLSWIFEVELITVGVTAEAAATFACVVTAVPR